jgi:hypothetical protein
MTAVEGCDVQRRRDLDHWRMTTVGEVRMRRMHPKKYALLGFVAVLLMVASSLYVIDGVNLYQGYQRAYPDWTSKTGPCGALITWSPPTVLYTGLYVNQASLVTIRYRSPQPQTLRMTVSIPQFTQGQTVQVQATPDFRSQAFKPQVLSTSVLDSLVGPGQRPAEVHLHIENSSGVVCETSADIVLKSREWMQWYDSAHHIDNTPYLAGWVTPTAAAIRTLLGRASQRVQDNPTDYEGLSGLPGYIGATPTEVTEEVDAIFDTLQFDYRLAYASDNIPFLQDSSQRIQLPSDILNSPAPSGMCVETTAIMASAVESLGMRPYFIILPGHAFLGVALSTSLNPQIGYWETSDLKAGLSITGNQANISGDIEFTQSKNAILETVDVELERQLGIMPIE